jgi:hypothetical protein
MYQGLRFVGQSNVGLSKLVKGQAKMKWSSPSKEDNVCLTFFISYVSWVLDEIMTESICDEG